ncbi:MAG: thiamine phosphate synthase [Nannocystaceae bacterium]
MNSRCSFSGLAITPDELPPHEVITGWGIRDQPAGTIAVLLRRAQTGGAVLLRDAALMDFASACRRAGHPVLLSCTAEEIWTSGINESVLREANLHGIQVKGDPTAADFAEASRRIGPDMVLGRSAHGPAPSSEPPPWSYTAVAPIYDTAPSHALKPTNGMGLAQLRAWCRVTPNVFALGGIHASNLRACVAAGAAGVAGIRLFFGAPGLVVDNVEALGRALADDLRNPR